MIGIVWALLAVGAGASLASGRVDVALMLGGAKALLVGWTFLELRHAARVHAALWAVSVVAIAGGLALALR